jgi:hypothetical protein
MLLASNEIKYVRGPAFDLKLSLPEGRPRFAITLLIFISV